MTTPLLQVEDLRVTFDTRGGSVSAVEGISFSVAAGRTLCLVGESGSGKSATALAIMGLLGPNARCRGRILFEGMDLASLTDAQRRPFRGKRMGMIFQEPTASLNPVLTIGQQVREAVQLSRSLSRRSAQLETQELLRAMRFSEPARVAEQYPHELSGGMNQRAMMAIALAGRPSLLIADEPTTALDVTVQAEILSLLRRIQAERRLSILLITHDLGVVAHMADDVAVMYAGQLVESGPASMILDNPRHPYTHGLWRSMPRIDSPDRPIPMAGGLPMRQGWQTGCRFRPRCPHAFEACERDPQILLKEESVGSACWRNVSSIGAESPGVSSPMKENPTDH
jgi:peptide/nickel transport system ATP-binding protein